MTTLMNGVPGLDNFRRTIEYRQKLLNELGRDLDEAQKKL